MNKKYIETLLAVQSSQQVIGVPAAPPNSVRPGTSSTNSYHTQPVWLKLHLHINQYYTNCKRYHDTQELPFVYGLKVMWHETMSSTDPRFKEFKTEVRRGGVGCTKDIK